MKVNLFKFFLYFYSLYFVKSSPPYLNNDDFLETEASGMDNLMNLRDPTSLALGYEKNISTLEERTKSLSETFEQLLELKVGSLIQENMDLLEENIRKIMQNIVEDKLNKIDEIIEEKMKAIYRNKIDYNLHEQRCTNNSLPTNCHELQECSNNIYSITLPLSHSPFPAVCDFKTDNGGWTIIQRRQDGSENFYRNWTEYVEGFGNMNGEFFIGLDKLHALTSLGQSQELYIILEDFEGERRYAKYDEFKVGSNTTEYTLTVQNYTGNAGDCFTQHSGAKFTTKDRDNDDFPKNCAERVKGAWWYKGCFYSNLNGLYLAGKMEKSKRGTSWCKFRNHEYSLRFVQMMIRPTTAGRG